MRSQVRVAEPDAAPDRGRSTAFRGSTVLQRPRQVSSAFGGCFLGDRLVRRATFQTFIVTLLLFLAGICIGQRKTETVTISEPATVPLTALFAQADFVAFVKIRSGDAASYKFTLYEAEVLDSYKGTKEEKDV